MYKKLIAFSLVLLLGGCAVKMTELAVTQMKNRRVTLAVAPSGAFEVQNAGAVLLLGATISAINAQMHGHSLRQSAQIPDPAAALAQSLGQRLANKYSMPLKNPAAPVETKAVLADGVSKELPASDVVLVTSSTLQRVDFFLSDMNNYKVTIVLWARLIDIKTRKDIVAGSCMYKPDYKSTNDAPSYKELFDNGAAGYKEEVKKAAAYCTDKMMKDIFSLPVR